MQWILYWREVNWSKLCPSPLSTFNSMQWILEYAVPLSLYAVIHTFNSMQWILTMKLNEDSEAEILSTPCNGFIVEPS